MRSHRLALAAALTVGLASATAVAQPAPHGPHPRLLLDDALRTQWKKRAKDGDSGVKRAIDHCAEVRKDPKEYAGGGYQSLEWSAHLQACLVAWAVTGSDDDAKTAMTYFAAMLDDLDQVGDGKGGDQAARRDSGFAIRAMGPPTALAYDWLHDHPLMTEALRAKARQRFAAWTSWYLEHGYRARDPGTNYNAGFVIASTFIAIAEGGEAGADGDKLWRLVADGIWGKDLAGALADGGILEGGDWTEGWQYGPLSVAEYAVSARVAVANGIKVDGVSRWLEALFTRTVHGLAPNDRVFAVGDTEDEEPSLPPSLLPLAAVVIGDAPPAVQAQAKGEIRRLDLHDRGFPLFEALVDGNPVDVQTPARETWPTSYLAVAAGVLYTRTAWRADAVWGAIQCNHATETDHHHPDAGNVVLSRGKDELVVDPSPYGTMSTLTSNAPTVVSAHFPEDYKPSQGFWSTATGYAFASQTATGALAVRCDYADQYKFQDTPSDVKRALRDFVLVPWNGGKDASLVIVDRATTGGDDLPMLLRFRTPAKLALDHDVAHGKLGGSTVAVRRVWASGGTDEVRHLTKGDCFKEGIARGKCEAARFDVDEYRAQIPGPSPAAIHVIDVSGGDAPAPATAAPPGARVVVLPARGGDPARTIVVADVPVDGLAWHVAKPAAAGAEQIILDAPAASDGTVGVTAAADGDGCKVTLSTGGGAVRVTAAPAAVLVDATCAVKDSAPRKAGAGPHITSHPGAPPPPPHGHGAGCCGAQASPGSSVTMAILVGLVLLRRRHARG